MWKHDLIRSNIAWLSKLKGTSANYLLETLNKLNNSIPTYMEFYLGDIGEYFTRKDIIKALDSAIGTEIKLPYKNFLISAIVPDGKMTCLVFSEPNEITQMVFLSRISKDFWTPPNWTTVLRDGIKFEFLEYDINLDKYRSVGGDFSYNPVAFYSVRLPILLHILLSCKNIEAQTIKPPSKLNNKLKKHNKIPHYSYKILKVHTPSYATFKSTFNKEDFASIRWHMQRGHFKEFTAEKPLFGRFTGRYWWQSHARGNKEIGTVEKDYEIVQG